MTRAGSILAATLLLSLPPLLCLGDVFVCDVSRWAEADGERDGWTLSGISAYADGGARFDSRNDFALSPPFAPVVTQVVMRVRSSSAPDRALVLAPVLCGAGAEVLRAASTDGSARYVEQVFAWPCEAAVRQFRLSLDTTGRYANWGVASLVVFTGGIAPPADLSADPFRRDAFRARWSPDPNAVASEISVFRVERVPACFRQLSEWDFSSLTNATGETRNFRDLDPPSALDGVEGEFLCLQAHEGGHLQIGKSDVAGVLSLPVPQGECALTCLLSVWKHAKDEGAVVPVRWVGADCTTNDLTSLTLTAAPQEFPVAIPSTAARLLLCATTSRRVRVARAAFVADYVGTTTTTNLVRCLRTSKGERVVSGLAPGDWLWSVRSFDRDGTVSGRSVAPPVVLDAERPAYCPPGLAVSVF